MDKRHTLYTALLHIRHRSQDLAVIYRYFRAFAVTMHRPPQYYTHNMEYRLHASAQLCSSLCCPLSFQVSPPSIPILPSSYTNDSVPPRNARLRPPTPAVHDLG